MYDPVKSKKYKDDIKYGKRKAPKGHHDQWERNMHKYLTRLDSEMHKGREGDEEYGEVQY